jgi:hypothetical protein
MPVLVEHEQPGHARLGHELADAIHWTIGRYELYRRRHHVLHDGLRCEAVLSDNAQSDVSIREHADGLAVGTAHGSNPGCGRPSAWRRPPRFRRQDPLDVVTHDLFAMHGWAPLQSSASTQEAVHRRKRPRISFALRWTSRLNQDDVSTSVTLRQTTKRAARTATFIGTLVAMMGREMPGQDNIETILRPGQLVGASIASSAHRQGRHGGGLGRSQRTHRKTRCTQSHPSVVRRQQRESSSYFAVKRLTASKVNHPNVVNIFDVIDHEGMTCIVMELLDGETLGELFAKEWRPQFGKDAGACCCLPCAA